MNTESFTHLRLDHIWVSGVVLLDEFMAQFESMARGF